MEPVFQRLGDVTIQRLEKPKEPKPAPQNNTNNDTEKADEDDTINHEDSSPEEAQGGTKRNLDSPASTSKKIKYDLNDIAIVRKLNDDGSLSFSDDELSDYETESEIDSENELLPPEDAAKEEKVNEENESLLADLAEADFAPDPEPPPADANSADAEDYDFDIKEKLKEMGEISFETVKKGDNKPKKPETTVENEVVVTPARKPGKSSAYIENLLFL